MLKKVAIILLLIIFIQMLPSTFASANVPFRNLEAFSALLIEEETETILFEHNAHRTHPAAALTRIMTVHLAVQAIENGDIRDNEIIEMTESAWYGLDDESNTLGIEPEERMRFLDLVYASFLSNSHEASNMIALRLGGSIDSFVAMMNRRATEIGLQNTRFTNANGRHDERQVTTAYDQFLFFREALTSSLFDEIASTFRHITDPLDEQPSRNLTSTNQLLNQGSRYFYRHSLAGVEGSSFEGGRSLIAYAQESEMTLFSVVLGAGEYQFEDGSVDLHHFTETVRLFHWGFDSFAWRDILRTTDLLERVPVLHGAGADFVTARPESSLTLLLNNSVQLESFDRHVTIYAIDNDEPLLAPVSAGEVLGEVVIMRGNVEYARIPVIANANVELAATEFMRRQIVDILTSTTARSVYIILALVLLLYLALLTRYHVLRINRRRRIRQAKNDLIRERHESFRE